MKKNKKVKKSTGTQVDFSQFTHPDGTLKETTFYSHYVPWQAVCLVAKGELPVIATSTPAIAPAE